MIYFGLFDESEEDMLRKCVVFYAAISARDKNSINKTFDTTAIDLITNQKIKRDLLPVIKRKDDFKLEAAKRLVKECISDLMVLTKGEKEFLDKFESGEYIPELIFLDVDFSRPVEVPNHRNAALLRKSITSNTKGTKRFGINALTSISQILFIKSCHRHIYVGIRQVH